jgi:hypothetical protein
LSQMIFVLISVLRGKSNIVYKINWSICNRHRQLKHHPILCPSWWVEKLCLIRNDLQLIMLIAFFFVSCDFGRKKQDFFEVFMTIEIN